MNEQNDRTYDDGMSSIIAISDAEWKNRRLCRNENCIGVIGKDGCCRKCGLPGGEDQEDDLPVRAADQGSTADLPEIGRTDDTLDDGDPEWSDRILCSDGNCIGVIGQDGFCKTCGKPLETAGADTVNPPE